MTGEAAELCLQQVRRNYGSVVAVNDVTLSVRKGDFLTLLGPSGSGKTSTLRIIGGFERIDSGRVLIGGKRVEHLPPYARDTATIFQSGALFPHKTVNENVAYGLRMRKRPKPEIQERVRHALDIVRLSNFGDRYPGQLSGGQKQRVAIARSLAVRPAILLFDEPLSALDLSLRLKLRAEIKRLHEEIGFTAVYVTHDQSEAMAMSSQVAVMNMGRIEQIDTPNKIFHEPANEFVFKFIGESCCLNVKAVGTAMSDENGQRIDLRMRSTLRDGTHRLYIRPSRIVMGAKAAACDNTLIAELRFVEFLGDIHRYHLAAGDLEIFCDQVVSQPHQAGAKIPVGWNDPDMKIYS